MTIAMRAAVKVNKLCKVEFCCMVPIEEGVSLSQMSSLTHFSFSRYDFGLDFADNDRKKIPSHQIDNMKHDPLPKSPPPPDSSIVPRKGASNVTKKRTTPLFSP